VGGLLHGADAPGEVPALPAAEVGPVQQDGAPGRPAHSDEVMTFADKMANRAATPNAATFASSEERGSQNRNMNLRDLAAEIVTAVGGRPPQTSRFEARGSRPIQRRCHPTRFEDRRQPAVAR
jgi:hypothetical protein